MTDYAALVHFYQGWALDPAKISGDGFPVYIDTTMIQIERPPTLKLNRAATHDDFMDHPDEYAVFQNEIKAKNTEVSESGYPLVYWPALSAAEVQMFAVRGIYTVEALAKLAGRRDMPGQLSELALRAERLMDMQKNFGKYESMLQERDAQLLEIAAQLKDARQTISAQNSIIDTLKLRVA